MGIFAFFKRLWKFLVGVLLDFKAPPAPAQVFFHSQRRIDMANFGVKFGFPPPGASDVAKRKLTVSGETREYTGDALISDEWVFSDGTTGTATLRDVDGAGNISDPSPPFDFTITDTVAPPAPGQLGIVETRQID